MGAEPDARLASFAEVLHRIAHLETGGAPLFVPRAGDVRWDDEEWHARRTRAIPRATRCSRSCPASGRSSGPGCCCGCCSSWAGLDGAAGRRSTASCACSCSGCRQPVATVLLALRHQRANHKHVTRADPAAAARARGGGRFVAHAPPDGAGRCLEHALGKATARGVARALRTGTGPLWTRTGRCLRFAGDARLGGRADAARCTRSRRAGSRSRGRQARSPLGSTSTSTARDRPW